jgi:hypothetical protein
VKQVSVLHALECFELELDKGTRNLIEPKSVLIFGWMFKRRSYFMIAFTDSIINARWLKFLRQ